MQVKCAITGIGAMGRKYALMLRDGVKGLRLTAVCCRSENNAAWAARNLPDVPVFRSEDELFKSADFDALIIVTPHKSHPATAIRAFGAGKHVLCDKPAGVTAADAEKINEAAKRSGKVYAMMCHQRANPQYTMIKSLLTSGEIGKIRRIHLENTGYFRTRFYHLSSQWRSRWTGEGGGVLINQGYHLLDMWQYLFGMPEAVYADIPFGKYNPFGVDDEATVIFDYPDKVTGTFIISTGEGCPEERLEIVGETGRIFYDGKTLTLSRFSQNAREYAASAQTTDGSGLKITEQKTVFGKAPNAYVAMLENFAAAVLSGEKPIAPGFDGAATLDLINAAYLSAWTGAKITLPVDMREYIPALRRKEAEESGRNP